MEKEPEKDDFEREFLANFRKNISVKQKEFGTFSSKWVDRNLFFDHQVMVITDLKDKKEVDIVFLRGSVVNLATDSQKDYQHTNMFGIETAVGTTFIFSVEDSFAAHAIVNDIQKRGANKSDHVFSADKVILRQIFFLHIKFQKNLLISSFHSRTRNMLVDVTRKRSLPSRNRSNCTEQVRKKIPSKQSGVRRARLCVRVAMTHAPHTI